MLNCSLNWDGKDNKDTDIELFFGPTYVRSQFSPIQLLGFS